jgi:hypothetical protein
MMFDVTQVRQALQHAVAIGACSPYFAATWPTRPDAIVFTRSRLVDVVAIDLVVADGVQGRP